MQTRLVIGHHFSVDVYSVERDTNGTVTNIDLAKTMKVSLDTGEGGGLNLDSEEAIVPGSILRNIKDRNGDLVFPSTSGPEGVNYTIITTRPLLSPLGTREGFTSSARASGY